jgi:hypothetical protein
MEPRTIAIGLIAIVAAFGAAFAISSSGGGKTATAGPGTKAETIKAPTAAAVTSVEVGGTIPALKAEKKKKPAKKESSSNNSTASTPSTTESTTQPETQTPTTQNTTPAPQNNTPAPQPQTPKPQPKPQNDGPVSGGGEDG